MAVADKPSRPVLTALTGLRFLAAAHVVVYHFGKPAFATAPEWVRNLLAGGDASVSLFFILSGFVLTYTYAASDHQLSRRAFWVSRLARIYPVYFVSLILAAPAALAELFSQLPASTAALKAISYGIPVFTLTQAWTWQTANKWNYPGWSLSAEAFFYLVFPILLVRLTTLRGKRLIVALAGLWAACLAAPLALVAFDPDHVAGQPQHYEGMWASTVAYLPLLHLPEFVMGMLLGKLFVEPPRTLTPAWAAIISTATLIGVVVLESLTRAPAAVIHNGLFAPLFAALIYALAGGRGPAAWVLSRPLLVLLGEASYSLYILQLPVYDWFSSGVTALSHAGPDSQPVPSFVGYLATLCVVSLLSFRYLEVPGRRVLRNVLDARPRYEPRQQVVGAPTT